MSNDFQVTLVSNVPNTSNTPSKFTTDLCRPIDLSGRWEVAITDITYSHEWTNIPENYHFVIAMPASQSESDTTAAADLADIQPRPKSLPPLANRKWVSNFVDRTPILVAVGEMNIEGPTDWEYSQHIITSRNVTDGAVLTSLVGESLATQFAANNMNLAAREGNTFCEFDTDKQRIAMLPRNGKFMIITPTNKSLLHLMGFGKQTKKFTASSGAEYEVLYVPRRADFASLEATMRMNLNTISTMFIYSDIVVESRVGNTMGNLLGYLPIKSKYGDQGYWNFNPPYYIPLKFQSFKSIDINLCLDTGELVPSADGKTICRLHFRRVSPYR